MEKRVVFNGRWLPALLLLPQLIITILFFFMPAGEALYQSLFRQDAFGLSLEFVGLENFAELFADEKYLASFQVTAVFAIGVTLLLTLYGFSRKALRQLSVQREDVGTPVAALAGGSPGEATAGHLPEPEPFEENMDKNEQLEYASRLAEQKPSIVAIWIDQALRNTAKS